MDEVRSIAEDIVGWLARKAGVSDVQLSVNTPKVASRSRLPFSRSRVVPPSFEVRFTFKGRPRVFRYFIEYLDDPTSVKNMFRVHTTGELMVEIPDTFGHLMPNDIYYGNRSQVAATLGSIAPPA